MASNQRLLKAYARFDGSGRVVASSTIFRKSMPKVGKWKEVQEYLCCNPVELFYTPASYPFNPFVEMFCNGVSVSVNYTSGVANNINELVAILNADAGTSAYGFYAPQSNGSVRLTVPQAVVDDLCPTGTLSFTILPD